ncbi:MAG: hypothetical protein ACXVJT_01995 [Thermoanaerobaculia bacterium]
MHDAIADGLKPVPTPTIVRAATPGVATGFSPSILLIVALFAACRTARLPDEAPVPPLQAESADAALSVLRQRQASLVDLHALVRVRVTTPGRSDSFRATVTVAKDQQMELTIYTPLNTTAATITSKGQTVVIRDAIHGSTETITTEDLARMYGIFLPDVVPSDMALLLLGFPSVAGAVYEGTPTGLRRAVIGDTTVDYDPPVQPVQKVMVTRPGQQVEMTVLEAVAR